MFEAIINENTEIKLDITLPETYKQDDYCKVCISIKNDYFDYECNSDDQFTLSDMICMFNIFHKILTYNAESASPYYDYDQEYVFYDSDIAIMTHLENKTADLIIRMDRNSYKIFIDMKTIKSLHKYLKDILQYFV